MLKDCQTGALIKARRVLVVLSLLTSIVCARTVDPARANGPERAAILFPFNGNTWLSGDGPGAHHHFWNAWAEDLHAPVGTAVKARFASSDGNISLSVASVGATCALPDNAGSNVTVNVYVDGTHVGEVIYGHLNGVQVATGPIAVGATLGYLNNWAPSSCWQDGAGDGLVHTHLEVEKGCYRNLSPWTSYPESTPTGLLNSQYASNNVSVCSENEVSQVATAQQPNPATPRFSDVTGDSRADAIVVNNSGTVVRRSTGSLFSANENWTTTGYFGSVGSFFADVTGDSRADAIVVNSNGVVVRRSTGSGFSSNGTWIGEQFVGSRGIFFADVTGDGMADAIVVNENGTTVRRSTGSYFSSNELWTEIGFVGSIGAYFADVTGDGKADAIVANTNGVVVRRSTGTGFGPNETWINELYVGSRALLFADVTGDGKSDAIVVNDNGTVVRRSTGSYFSSNELWTETGFFGNVSSFFADVTGDGMADAIVVNTNGVVVRRSTGTAFNPNETWIVGPYVSEH